MHRLPDLRLAGHWLRHIGARRRAPGRRRRPRSATARSSSSCRLRSSARGLVRRLTWLAADLCDYNGPLLAPRLRRPRRPRQFAALLRGIAAAAARRPALPLRRRRPRQDAGDGRRPAQPVPRPRRRAQSERRLSRPSAPTGTPSTPPSARPRRASATAPSGSGSATSARSRFVTPRTRRDRAATLATLFRSRKRGLCPHGRRRPLRAARLSRLLLDLADRPGMPATGPCQPARCRRRHGGGQSRLRFRGRYYHVLVSYDAGEVVALRPGRGAPPRAHAPRHRAASSLRLHHRRRALQARMVATPS